MLIMVILDRPDSPRFTRVHHGSLGLGRPRSAPGVRGWARQRPEASRCLAGGTPVVTVGYGYGDHGIPGAGVYKERNCSCVSLFNFRFDVNIFQILFRRTLPPRNTS